MAAAAAGALTPFPPGLKICGRPVPPPSISAARRSCNWFSVSIPSGAQGC